VRIAAINILINHEIIYDTFMKRHLRHVAPLNDGQGMLKNVKKNFKCAKKLNIGL